MCDIVNIDDYRNNNELDNGYIQFFDHVHKLTGVPTTLADVVKTFYYSLRYVESNLTALNVISAMNCNDESQIAPIKESILSYLHEIQQDIENI